MVAAAMVGAAVVGGVASNAAANKGAKAATSAANTQAAAADRANETQRLQYEQTREDYAPWREAGVTALGKLGYLSGDKSQPAYDWQTDPGYGFRLAEGEKGINRAAAARGGFNSGGTLKDLSRFNSNLASQEYGNAWNRLSSLAGIGQTATGQLGQLGQSYSQSVGANTIGAGNAMAAGQVGAANARASGYGGIASSLGNAYQNYQTNQWMKNNNSGGGWGDGGSFNSNTQFGNDFGGSSGGTGGGTYSDTMYA